MIVRNVNVMDGLTNNTRVRVVKMLSQCFFVELLSFPRTQIFLPRLRFCYRLASSRSFEIIRAQFPLRRAFAMTYNKSQGQTLDKVLLDVRSYLFNHGYLYIGLSRVQLYSNIALFLNNTRLMTHLPPSDEYYMSPHIANLVYCEALQYL